MSQILNYITGLTDLRYLKKGNNSLSSVSERFHITEPEPIVWENPGAIRELVIPELLPKSLNPVSFQYSWLGKTEWELEEDKRLLVYLEDTLVGEVWTGKWNPADGGAEFSLEMIVCGQRWGRDYITSYEKTGWILRVIIDSTIRNLVLGEESVFYWDDNGQIRLREDKSDYGFDRRY